MFGERNLFGLFVHLIYSSFKIDVVTSLDHKQNFSVYSSSIYEELNNTQSEGNPAAGGEELYEPG